MIGTLYVVATPIGNLEDITLRAVRTLGEVDRIFAEDTRVTRKLLSAHRIETPVESYHAHSTDAKHDRIVELLREGARLALVTDAGTPLLSDPGILLVKQVREAFGDEARVEAIPGPSALTAAISVSDISCARFQFLGFLPHKKGRSTLIEQMLTSSMPTVFYESPHRMVKLLDALIARGAGDRRLFVARELTKLHETHYADMVHRVAARFEREPATVRGEFVCILDGFGEAP